MIGRREILSLPLAGVTVEGGSKAHQDILFRFHDTPPRGMNQPMRGAFLFSQVAGYYELKTPHSDWICLYHILLKGAGQSHTLTQETFERFEREYVAWHEWV